MTTETPSTAAKPAHSYVRVCVRRPGTDKYTTVSMSPSEFKKALGYTGGNSRAVTDALRYVAAMLDPLDVLPGDFSLQVRRKALARLRGQMLSPQAKLAAENNAAWSAQ